MRYLLNPIRKRYLCLILADVIIIGLMMSLLIGQAGKIWLTRLVIGAASVSLEPFFLFLCGFYDFDKPVPPIRKNLVFCGFNFAFTALVFLRHGASSAHLNFFAFFLIGLALYIVVVRVRLVRFIFSKRISVFLLGADEPSRMLVAEMECYPLRIFDVVVVCTESACSCQARWEHVGHRILHNKHQVAETLRSRDFDLILYTPNGGVPPELQKILVRKKLEGVSVCDVPTYFKQLTNRVPVDCVTEQWFLSAQDFIRPQFRRRVKIKRVLDVLGAVLLTPFIAPLCWIIAGIVYLEDRESAVYPQLRRGQFGKPFVAYKFRTMSIGTEEESVVTRQGDRRVTRVGKLVRRLHLDELLQVLNVLRGEISFIGPRPLSEKEEQKLFAMSPFYEYRYLVPPGLTGWAQAHEFDSRTPEGQRRRLEFDLFYVMHQSFALDFFIGLKTFRSLLFGLGAR